MPKMRNRTIYWALALFPVGGLWVVSQIFGPIWFTAFLLVYLFVYRPLIDTQRLLSLNAIEEKDAWRFFVPLAVDRLRYTKALWLG